MARAGASMVIDDGSSSESDEPRMLEAQYDECERELGITDVANAFYSAEVEPSGMFMPVPIGFAVDEDETDWHPRWDETDWTPGDRDEGASAESSSVAGNHQDEVEPIEPRCTRGLHARRSGEHARH